VVFSSEIRKTKILDDDGGRVTLPLMVWKTAKPAAEQHRSGFVTRFSQPHQDLYAVKN
jgi:hypothetical protein